MNIVEPLQRSITPAAAATRNNQFAWCLIILLGLDVVWSATHAEKHTKTWAMINIPAAALLFVVLRYTPFQSRIYLLAISVIAVLRTVLDYGLGRGDYLPDS